MIELKDKGSFDVIVVGGGHAGIEASLISAKMGSKTAMITLDKKKIGAMHCNPSIGGSAKGIVVREIDALGGEMAKATDRTALQFKLLGTAGGPATQSLRVQSDKISYSDYMIFQVEKQNLLKIIEASVERIVIENDKTKGVITNEGNFYSSKAVIITTGTYLSPITFKGNEKKIEGPDGEKKVSSNISSQLKEIGFKFKRFKTGTSPRVLTNSINFKALTKEEGTNLPLRFSQDSDLTDLIKFNDQLPCYLTHTNRKTHDLIKENFHLSAIFAIPEMGVGPRYCPSIEDKVFRFSDKDKHQVFLEPESTKLDTTYIQGLSTSLPKDIQKKILQTIEGLENAEVKKWGYAIEYDVIETSQLNLNLETKKIKNLFTAGQINGTTGYEEAAAQGLVAGINACLNISGKAPLILGRDKSYIGVMIDDLVNKEVNDPYRLLTSRAEYRLLLRHDNSHTRLFPICKSLGLVSESLWKEFLARQEVKSSITRELKKKKIKKDKINEFLPYVDTREWKTIKEKSVYELIKMKNVSLRDFSKFIPKIKEISWEEEREIEIEVKYEGYIKRQLEEVTEMKKNEFRKIPRSINYDYVEGLAKEAKEKLKKIKPENFGQATRIAGINPTDIQMLNYHLKKLKI